MVSHQPEQFSNRLILPILQLATVVAGAWIIAAAPLWPLCLGIGMLTVALLLVRWPWLIWLGLAVSLPISSGIKIGPLSVTDLALALAVALWFADGVRRRTLRLRLSPVSTMLLLYLGAL